MLATNSPMTRRYRDQTFRKADVIRGMRAARAGGMRDPCLVIDNAHKLAMIVPGEMLVKNSALPGEPPKDNAADINPWDEVLTNVPNEKRPS